MENSWDLEWIRKYVLPIAKLTKTSFEGWKHIPKKGKALFCPTHGGWLALDDLFCYSLLVDRLEENIPAFINPLFFNLPGIGDVMRKIGALPLDKLDDIEFLKSHARFYFIAPEGAAGSTKPFYEAYKLRTFKPGFIRLAIKLRATILPIASIGNEDLFPVLFRTDKFRDIIGTSVPVPFTLFPLPLTNIRAIICDPVDCSKFDLSLADNPVFCIRLAEKIRKKQQKRVNYYAKKQPLFRLNKLIREFVKI